MNKIDEIKEIALKQKTIRTSRLSGYLTEIERMYIEQGRKIKRQREQLEKQNTLIQKLNNKKKKDR